MAGVQLLATEGGNPTRPRSTPMPEVSPPGSERCDRSVARSLGVVTHFCGGGRMGSVGAGRSGGQWWDVFGTGD